MTQIPTSELEFKLDTTVSMPTPESERRFGIRVVDWNRIKRNINRFDESPPALSRMSDICLSISVTACFTAISLFGQQNISAWIEPVIICITILFFFFGIVFIQLNKKEIEKKQKEVKDFQEDVIEIEKTFESCYFHNTD